MGIRLLGGFAKDFEVKNEKTVSLKPTLSQLKRKIFDRYQNLEEFSFIDLCAGTGSIGLEALSRGACEVYFIEKSKKNFFNLKNNIKRFESKYKNDYIFSAFLINTSFKAFLAQHSFDNPNTIYYFDPPFDQPSLYKDFFECAESLRGKVLIEGDQQKTVSDKEVIEELSKQGFELVKTYKSGSHYIIYFDR